MVVVACLLALALLIFVFSPFWLGQGGQLLPSGALNEPQKIKKLQVLILKRYLVDEEAFHKGFITAQAWKQRQLFLSNRYLDLARRHDYLSFLLHPEEQQGLQDSNLYQEGH